MTTKQLTKNFNLSEQWKDIPEYEGFYQISDLGRIKSLSRSVNSAISVTKITNERILKLNNVRGYRYVSLCKLGVVKKFKVHRLIMYVFKGESNLHVNHIDGNKSNNCIENLEYVTATGNKEHAHSLGNYRRNIVQCQKTGTIYNSIKEAAIEVGIKREYLSQQLHGNKKNKTTLKIIKYAANKKL